MLFKFNFTILFILIILAQFFFAGPAMAEPALPPYPLVHDNLVGGEELKYEAGWNGIPAASAAVSTSISPQDPNIFTIKASAWTRGYVSWLWRMRSELTTEIDKNLFRPVTYEFYKNENYRVETRVAEFDYDENSINIKRTKKERLKSYEIPLGVTYDPISAAMLLRSISLSEGESPRVEVCEGKRVYLVTMDILGKEDLKIKLGTFPAYRMSISFKELYASSDPPSKKKKFHWAVIWLSADEYRIPLKIESKVFVGSVYLELISENRGLVGSRE